MEVDVVADAKPDHAELDVVVCMIEADAAANGKLGAKLDVAGGAPPNTAVVVAGGAKPDDAEVEV